MPRAENAHKKAKEHAEETGGSGSEEDHSDSDDEGIDGYKKGWTLRTQLIDIICTDDALCVT